jgi:hypothetical protein
MLHSTQLPSSSSKYVPGSHAIVGITVGAGDGAIVVGRLVGAWVNMVGTDVGPHVCVAGSASQQTVPRRVLPVLTCQFVVTILERACTSVGTLSHSCGLGVGFGTGVRVSIEGDSICRRGSQVKG